MVSIQQCPLPRLQECLWHMAEARKGALEHLQAWFCYVSPKDRHTSEARGSLWVQTPSSTYLYRCAVSHSKERGKKL